MHKKLQSNFGYIYGLLSYFILTTLKCQLTSTTFLFVFIMYHFPFRETRQFFCVCVSSSLKVSPIYHIQQFNEVVCGFSKAKPPVSFALIVAGQRSCGTYYCFRYH